MNVLQKTTLGCLLSAIFLGISAKNCSTSGNQLLVSDIPAYLEFNDFSTSVNSLYIPEDCLWILRATHASSVIKLEVLNTTVRCSDGYVSVHDGPSVNSSRIRNWCASENPKIISTADSLTILYHTKNLYGYNGFRIKYYQALESSSSYCSSSNSLGHILTASDTPAYLQSDNYPFNYYFNMDCRWILTAADISDVVELQVLDSQLEQNSNCAYDYIKAFDGNSQWAPLIRRWCGNGQSALYSTGRSMAIEFHSDNSLNYKGFRLQYRQVSANTSWCTDGMTLSALDTPAYLQSAHYPSLYETNMDCTWILRAVNTSAVIELKVLDSQLEQSSSCEYDYVQTFDGDYLRPLLIRMWCGNSTPTVYSTGRSMIIKFHSDDSNNYRGFRMQYRQISASANTGWCNDVKTLSALDTPTNLQSPHYPSLYETNMDCTWILRAVNTSAVIALKVLDSQLEQSSTCEYDYVQTYDGSSLLAPAIRRWCGNSQPTVYSSSRSMAIKFHSDGSNNYRGFRMQYRQISAAAAAVNTSLCNSISNLWASDFPAYLQSAHYPFLYDSNMDCTWVLRAVNTSAIIELKVVDSLLEQSSSCNYDYVQAFDGSTQYASLIRKWCGNSEPTIYSTGYSMTIQFHSDSSNNYKGFQMQYRQVNAAASCPTASTLLATDIPAYIQSVNYPNNYYPNLDCKWTLQVTDLSLVVQLTVIDSYLESSSSCSYDYVETYDGTSAYYPVIRRWCGEEEPTVYSTGSSMTVLFHSDGSQNYKGFRLQFQQIPLSQVPEASHASGIVIAICFAGLIIVLGVVITIIVAVKNRQAHSLHNARALPGGRTNTNPFVTATSRSLTTQPGGAVFSLPCAPPAYSECLQQSFPAEPPPSYPGTKYLWNPGSANTPDARQTTASQPAQSTEQTNLGIDNPAFVRTS